MACHCDEGERKGKTVFLSSALFISQTISSMKNKSLTDTILSRFTDSELIVLIIFPFSLIEPW